MRAVAYTCVTGALEAKVHWHATGSPRSPTPLKNIINPIMREILMRCALKSDSGFIIRVILPVVESWSWTEACSVAESEKMLLCM